MPFSHLIFFFKIIFVINILQVPPVSNSLDRDQAQHFILPDLGPNCLKSRLRWYKFTSIVPDMSED